MSLLIKLLADHLISLNLLFYEAVLIFKIDLLYVVDRNCILMNLFN